jgi:hypothetical protein
VASAADCPRRIADVLSRITNILRNGADVRHPLAHAGGPHPVSPADAGAGLLVKNRHFTNYDS